MKKVAIYARVSTDKGQTVENQLRQLQEVGERLNWVVVAIHLDQGISGAKGRDGRPGFDALLLGVARKEFDLIAAWSVDRLGRSLQDLIGFLSDIQARGVDLYLHQQGVDTSTPSGRMLFQLLSVFAEFERSIIRDRVLSGLQRAKAKGTRIGRPPMPPAQVRRIQEALAGGAGVRQVARLTGTSPTTVSRIRQTMLIEQQEQQVVAA
jgi:DNA invertase Pin-like site-specific DNA recombinase